MAGLTALVFLIPLGTLMDRHARAEALADAARRAGVVAGALAVNPSAKALSTVRDTPHAPAADRLAVHGLPEGGEPRADARTVDRARADGPLTAAVPGGVVHVQPVPGQSLVVEVFVPESELSAGRWPWLVGAALALVVVAVALVDRYAARAVAAVRTLIDAATRMGEGDLTVRVTPSGPREIAEAGYTFNRMAERLAAARADERELVADLSHRLRTPLTVLRLDADALDSDDTSVGTYSAAELDRRRTIRRIRQAIATLEGEVDVLINTTRKAVAQESGPEICDVSEVVRERMKFWSALAEDQNRPHRVLGAHVRIPVKVQRAELAAALDAILGNVFRYTPQGTAFEVAVSRRNDGYVAIRIDDAGPGIANPDRALRRGASDTGSTGLGLDIAKRVAQQANGSVSIDRAALGGASVVMLLADAEAKPRPVSRFGLVGRRARERESGRRRWPRQRGADDEW